MAEDLIGQALIESGDLEACEIESSPLSLKGVL